MLTFKHITGLVAAAICISAAAAQTTNETVSDQSWVGVITKANTPIRCGANESYYPIASADSNQLVRVYGKRQDWLRVETDGEVFQSTTGYVKYPAGTTDVFSVEGNTGTAQTNIEVLACNVDSEELYRSWRPIYQLVAGDTVQVIETTTTDPGTLHRESYVVHTIQMPSMATAWVNASSVARASDAQAGAWGTWVRAGNGGVATNTGRPSTWENATSGDVSDNSTTTSADENEADLLEPPSLVELEARWEVITKEPAMGAEISPLRDMYQELFESSEGDLVIERIAAARIKQLDVWNGLRAQRIKIDDLRKELAAKTEEVTDYQGVMSTFDEYAVTGRLALSNTFDGLMRPLMYRIQDAKSGRTLGYLAANKDWGLSNLVGQTVGVKGETAWDPHYRVTVIEGTSLDLVSPTTATVSPDIQ